MVDNVTERMLTAVPSRHGCDLDTLRECIEAIQTVTQVTLACADARLAEQVVDELTNHERILLATAGVCETTAGVLSRGAGLDPVVVRAPQRLLDGMSSRPRGGRSRPSTTTARCARAPEPAAREDGRAARCWRACSDRSIGSTE